MYVVRVCVLFFLIPVTIDSTGVHTFLKRSSETWSDRARRRRNRSNGPPRYVDVLTRARILSTIIIDFHADLAGRDRNNNILRSRTVRYAVFIGRGVGVFSKRFRRPSRRRRDPASDFRPSASSDASAVAPCCSSRGLRVVGCRGCYGICF